MNKPTYSVETDQSIAEFPEPTNRPYTSPEEVLLLTFATYPKVARGLIEDLEVEDFTRPHVQRVFLELQRRTFEGRDWDLPIVADAVARDNVDESKLLSWIATGQWIDPTNHTRLIRTVTELRYNRAQRNLAAATKKGDPELIREYADRAIAARGTGGLAPLTETYRAHVNNELDQQGKRVPFGINWIDHLTGGMPSGALVTVGGSTSAGKSAFASQITLNSLEQGQRVCFFSLEMDRKEVLDRLLMQADAKRNNDALLSAGNWVERCLVDSGSRLGPADIRMRLHAAGDVDLVVVDYVGLLQSPSMYRSAYERMSYLTRELKVIASEFNVPLLMLAQLNRAATPANAKGEKNPVPTLSMFRDSGSVEQDSNIALLIGRAGGDLRHVIVAKNRHGNTSAQVMNFNKTNLKFEEHP